MSRRVLFLGQRWDVESAAVRQITPHKKILSKWNTDTERLRGASSQLQGKIVSILNHNMSCG
jgi:hypothetical protein